MIPGALDKLTVSGAALKNVRSGILISNEGLPDWNIKKGTKYKIHWDDEEGPYIFSSKPLAADRIDLWTLDDKLAFFNWIRE